MTMQILTWLMAIPLLGFATGLRTMTPIAVLCWFGYLGHLPVHHHWAFWTTRLVTAVVFTVLALGEFVVDKLPQTPARIKPFPFAARLIFSGLVGALAATALHASPTEGVVLALLGGVVGTFGGFLARIELVRKLGCKDWYVAVGEDVLAICFAILAMGVITG